MPDWIVDHQSLLLLFVLLLPLLLGLPSLIATTRGLADAKRIYLLNAVGIVFFSAWGAALAWAISARPDISYYERVLERKWHYLGIAGSAGILLLGLAAFANPSVVKAAIGGRPSKSQFAAISQGPVVQRVTATGKIEPLEIVQVGSQVTGPVIAVFKDANDVVHAGEVIARIDPRSYAEQLAQTKANLERVLAAQGEARAALAAARSRLVLARANLERQRSLGSQGFATRAQVDEVSAAEQEAESAAAQGVATVDAASAAVSQAVSQLRSAQLDLSRTYIRSPVDGIVLKRQIEPGQTVVSNFQTATLFEIARDLSRMRVEAAVDETDVGTVRVGQQAQFSVDAYPDRMFEGRVASILKAPVDSQGVVMFPVRIEFTNPSNAELYSGMTANVSIVTLEKQGALRVPTAALRHLPADHGSQAYLLVRSGGRLARVPIQTGADDGPWTEVVSPRLNAKAEVLIGSATGN